MQQLRSKPMKQNLETLQIKGLEQKIREYNVLHRKLILNINLKDTREMEKDLNGISSWFKLKGLSFEKSTLKWEQYIESMHGSRAEKDELAKIREEKAENIRNQHYELATELRIKERAIPRKWAKPVSAEEFYRTYEVLNFVSQFTVRKNVCDYYL